MPFHRKILYSGITCLLAVLLAARALPAAPSDRPLVVAQAMVPPTGMGTEDQAMAARHMAEAERMRRRFPQPVKVGDLIGIPVLDDDSRTLGHVREVVRTPQGDIELIVSYGGWFGWGTRLLAVPIEVVGIFGRQLASLDMPPSAYAAAPTWHDTDDTILNDDANISVALARR
ncbi:MAG: PRC-barrel domain-containing protein [Xanthobacteraceae bacterium]